MAAVAGLSIVQRTSAYCSLVLVLFSQRGVTTPIAQVHVNVFKVLVGYWDRYLVQFAWLGRYMHLNASWVSGRLEHLEQDKISLETRWDTSLWDRPVAGTLRGMFRYVLSCFYVVCLQPIASWAIHWM